MEHISKYLGIQGSTVKSLFSFDYFVDVTEVFCFGRMQVTQADPKYVTSILVLTESSTFSSINDGTGLMLSSAYAYYVGNNIPGYFPFNHVFNLHQYRCKSLNIVHYGEALYYAYAYITYKRDKR